LVSATNRATELNAAAKTDADRDKAAALNAAAVEATAAINRAKEINVVAQNDASAANIDAKNKAEADALLAINRANELNAAAQTTAAQSRVEAENKAADTARLIAADKEIAKLNADAQKLSTATTQSMAVIESMADNITKLKTSGDFDTTTAEGRAALDAAVKEQKDNAKTTLTLLEKLTKIEGLTSLVTFDTPAVVAAPAAVATPAAAQAAATQAAQAAAAAGDYDAAGVDATDAGLIRAGMRP
jgi:hypothetical protein